MFCEHALTTNKVTLEIFGNKKIINVKYCKQCDSEIYDEEYQAQFGSWLSVLKKKDKLKVQNVRVMEYTRRFIEFEKNRIPAL